MYEITSGLWQGGMPEKLNESITAVISLAVDWPIYNAVTNDRLCHILIPIPDTVFPGVNWLRMAVRMIGVLRKTNHVVYVHCREGVSRSVMLVAAYLMYENAWNLDVAMETIAMVNPKLNPNKSFMLGLKEWEDEC